MLDPPSAIIESIMIPLKLLSMLFSRITNLSFLLTEKQGMAMILRQARKHVKECDHVQLTYMYLASVIDHVGLIQIHFSTAAAVSRVSKRKTVNQCWFKFQTNYVSGLNSDFEL